MKTVSALVFLLGLHFFSSAQGVNDECLKKIRTGTFYTDLPGYENYYIVRTKKKQIEYSEIDGQTAKMILTIKWLDDYTYQLTTKKFIGYPDGYPTNKEVFIVKITACKSDYFLTESEYKGQLFKIKYYFSESE